MKRKKNPFDSSEVIIGCGSDIIVRQTAFDDEIPTWLLPRKITKKQLKIYFE